MNSSSCPNNSEVDFTSTDEEKEIGSGLVDYSPAPVRKPDSHTASYPALLHTHPGRPFYDLNVEERTEI